MLYTTALQLSIGKAAQPEALEAGLGLWKTLEGELEVATINIRKVDSSSMGPSLCLRINLESALSQTEHLFGLFLIMLLII
ncbi:hypothetical protein Y1Q_0017047 [Alligator mississippiensis]|uniref:Uncharacterized protein n=1 Tax=Alligator mississippiensis TaxID=8496 RepID=A0A151NT69_ALLMI|nr:hypothetical protein Y1Q_0017047 [Alligator mississippiensis]